MTRNPDIPHDTEDKAWWLTHGENLEKRFVELCLNSLGISAQINPEKESTPTAPDLLVEGRVADLKVQNTPFFTSGRYKLNPRFTVTFNRKDFERYTSLYPTIDIYYWVAWKQAVWNNITVEPIAGIWRAPFSSIRAMIEGGAPEHRYIHRKQDTGGNAKSSFLLDLAQFETIAMLDSVEPTRPVTGRNDNIVP